MSKNENGSRITSLCHNYYKLVKISSISDNLHTDTELFKKRFWNKNKAKKKVTVPDESHLPGTTHNYFPLDFFL